MILSSFRLHMPGATVLPKLNGVILKICKTLKELRRHSFTLWVCLYMGYTMVFSAQALPFATVCDCKLSQLTSKKGSNPEARS